MAAGSLTVGGKISNLIACDGLFHTKKTAPAAF